MLIKLQAPLEHEAWIEITPPEHEAGIEKAELFCVIGAINPGAGE